MANSLMQIVSDGSLSVIPLSIKFFEQNHIRVYVNNVELPDGTYTFAWSGATTLTITPAVALGSEVSIRRKTPADAVIHDFQAGAVFSEVSVDENFRQELFLLQEASEQSFVTDLFADLDMHGNAIHNVATAVNPGDAVNLAQAQLLADGGEAGTLRDELNSSAGATMIGHAGRKVANFIGDHIIVRPVGNPAGDLAALVDAAATGMKITTLAGDTFVLDNSAGPAWVISADNVTLTGKGVIRASHDTNDLIQVTGDYFDGTTIRLEGNGNYRPDLGSTGNPPSLLKVMGDHASVMRVRCVNPYCGGIFVLAAAGARIVRNTVISAYAGSISAPFLFQIGLYVASDTLIYGNTVLGGIQGISAGGSGSGLYTVVGLNGLTTSNVRNTIIAFNTCAGQLDHSIYVSNNSVQTTITFNQLECANDLIKIEGGPNVVTNNRGVGGSGITGRNVLNTLITGNVLITTLSSVNAYGILLYEQQFKRAANDITIADNTLTCIGGTSKAGIYVVGEVWDGYQSVISNLDIHNNKVIGYGDTSEGFGIGVRQQLFAGNPVTGAMAEGVKVDDNLIVFPPHVLPTYGIVLSEGIKGGSCSGNTIRGFRSQGVRSLGVQDMGFFGNTLIADPSATGLFGFFERAKDLTFHYNSQNNRYGNNVFKGTFSRLVGHSDETCVNADRIVLRRTGAVSSDTVIASQWPKMVVYTNPNAGAVITIDALAGAPWPIDSDLVIANASATNTITVNPGGFSVSPLSSLRLVGVGSNAWIRVN
jgi:hypothetical protein